MQVKRVLLRGHMFAVLVLGALGLMPAQAGIIFQDSFDSYQPGLGLTTLGNVWQVVPGSDQPSYTGNIDLLGAGVFPWVLCGSAGGADQCVDMAGSSGFQAGARLQTIQVFTFLPGIVYNLAFDLSGSRRYNSNTLIAGITDGVNSVTYTVHSMDGFSRINQSFSVPSQMTGRIFFDNSSNRQGDPNGYYGVLIDNVTLMESPEPATWLLSAAGLLVFAMTRRR